MANILVYLFYQLFALSISAMAQTNGIIAVGSSLTADYNVTPWLSPSGDFAFGFQQIQTNGPFLLSIWYDKIPDKTIVWFSNEATQVQRGSRIQLTLDRGLVLSDPQGKQLWNSYGSSPNHVSYGVMNNTGNFELVGSGSIRIWSTFQHPSDTLLPTQIMEREVVLNSRLTPTNFSRGWFKFRFQQDGNFVLYTQNAPYNSQYGPTYATGTNDPGNATNIGYQVIFNETGYLYVLKVNNESILLTTPKKRRAADNYFRATLDSNGVFTQYYHPRNFTGNPGWSPLWWQPINICNTVNAGAGSGACGFNSICSIQDFGKPFCECPQSYVLLDPNDMHSSCKPNFTLSCDEDQPTSLYDFKELTGTDWPNSEYDFMDPISEEECRSSCATDCFCALAFYQGTTCWKKHLPFANGRKDSQINGKAFLKYRKGSLTHPNLPLDPASQQRKKPRKTLVLVGSILLGSSVFVNFVLFFAASSGCFLIYRKKKIKHPPVSNALEMETNLRCFSYRELAEATDRFKEELGRGAFGIVSKGVLGTNFIAVKKLREVVENGDREFKTEVDVIAKTHHKNLVSLLGFCNEGEQRLLVYEYMSNGTLADFLFADKKPSWRQRTHIALGIARGLSYLHEECSTQIIHCDIKPQNVLLDEHYEARISDFGLSKLLRMNQSQTNTAIRGTKGYVAPEWFRNTPVTVKVDVYSFGVLLLEIISCRRSVQHFEPGDEERAILTDWVWDCFQKNKLSELIDNDLEVLSEIQKLEMFVKIGIWCIQENPNLRPTMRKVTQMLEGVTKVTEPPCPTPNSL